MFYPAWYHRYRANLVNANANNVARRRRIVAKAPANSNLPAAANNNQKVAAIAA